MADRFTSLDLLTFLAAVNHELTQSCSVMLIGESAVGAIDPAHATTDVDLLSPGSRDFDAAVERLAARGVAVLPVQIVTVADAPEGFLERALRFPLQGTSKLVVLMPERHDLAIMKLARGYEHDLQALEDIHRLKPFELNILVERYRETEVIGPRRRFALAFLDLVSRLFGDEEAEKLNSLLDGLHW